MCRGDAHESLKAQKSDTRPQGSTEILTPQREEPEPPELIGAKPRASPACAVGVTLVAVEVVQESFYPREHRVETV